MTNGNTGHASDTGAILKTPKTAEPKKETWQDRHAAVSMPLMEELMAHKARARISNAELSRRSGLSGSTLVNWEKKRVRPLMSSVQMAARSMGLRLTLVREN